MSRYIGPVCRLCRREATKLFLKGEKCYTKCVLDARPTPPGAAKQQRGKPSEFAIRLREKQKLRRLAQISEGPMERLMGRASKASGRTGETLLRYLEMRLDNVVRRMGFAVSLKSARQIVLHNHVRVNGRAVNIPSFEVRTGDVLSVTAGIAETITVKQGLEMAEKRKNRPSFLEFNPADMTGKVLREPSRDEMSFPVKEQLIVEYYSK